ncbi:MAG: hypothetical protein ACK4MT_04600, partial [Thermaurantiacus tibetensis]
VLHEQGVLCGAAGLQPPRASLRRHACRACARAQSGNARMSHPSDRCDADFEISGIANGQTAAARLAEACDQ